MPTILIPVFRVLKTLLMTTQEPPKEGLRPYRALGRRERGLEGFEWLSLWGFRLRASGL